MSVKTKPLKARANALDGKIGINIRRVRNEMGLSQVQVAEAMGVTFQQLQKYETGFNRISAARLGHLALLLQRPITDFFPPEYNIAQNKMAEIRAILNL